MRLFDDETGEIREPEVRCPHCAEAAHERVKAEADLRNVEKELRRLRRINQNLEAEIRRQREESPEGRVARALGRYWIARCGKDSVRTKLGEKRLKAVVARIRDGYTPEYIARAIDGIAEYAYVNPQTGQKYDDLELVCRDEVHLERFHDLAERMNATTLVGAAWLHEFGSTPSESGQDSDVGF